MKGGRLEEQLDLHALPLIYGMGIRKRRMNNCLLPMKCLIVGMPHIFLMQSD